jgi:hypothetical protein
MVILPSSGTTEGMASRTLVSSQWGWCRGLERGTVQGMPTILTTKGQLRWSYDT